jgi:hypothetical protein
MRRPQTDVSASTQRPRSQPVFGRADANVGTPTFADRIVGDRHAAPPVDARESHLEPGPGDSPETPANQRVS